MTKPYFEDDAVQIWHGDCRDVLPTLQLADLVLTDPPYGVDAKYDGAYDDAREGYWDWFLPALELVKAAAPVTAFTHRQFALKHIHDWDWLGVWHKPYSAGAHIGNSPILPHWEPIFFYGIHTLGVRRSRADVFTINPTVGGGSNGKQGRQLLAAETNGVHPRPKPLRLFSGLVELLSEPGQTVLDPFMGSGTTLRAAKDLGRKAIGIEVSEAYCENAARRMAQGVLPLEMSTKGGEKAPR